MLSAEEIEFLEFLLYKAKVNPCGTLSNSGYLFIETADQGGIDWLEGKTCTDKLCTEALKPSMQWKEKLQTYI